LLESGFYARLRRLLTHILPPQESEIVAAVIFFRILSKKDLLSIFGDSNRPVGKILRKLEAEGVLNYREPFYSVNSEKLLEMIGLKREELREELERECSRFSRILLELSILTAKG
jgi:transcription initiation factor IIE alpha subunit